MYLKNRVSWTAVFLIVLLVYLANLSWLFVSKTDPSWIGRNIFALLLYWSIGAFSVDICSQEKSKHRFRASALLAGYLAYSVISHYVNFKGSHYFKSIALAVLTAYLLGLVFQREHEKPLKGNIVRTLSKIGERSYSLYVVHSPVLSMLALIFVGLSVNNTYIQYGLGILGTAVLTILCYIYRVTFTQVFHRVCK